MDERLKYEQLIGSKLQSLPVPDMQDAIWARVKTQLDLDMPTDDGNGGSSPQAPSGPTIIGWGLSVVIIGLVTIFFLFKNKPSTKTNSKQPVTIEQTVSPNAQSNSPPLQKSSTSNKTTNVVGTGANNSLTNIGNDSSSIQHQPVTIVPRADDSVRTNVAPPFVTVSPPPLADTTSVAKKKGRGMTGLNDSSYRIVPKNKD
jgi:hypothetical protein